MRRAPTQPLAPPRGGASPRAQGRARAWRRAWAGLAVVCWAGAWAAGCDESAPPSEPPPVPGQAPRGGRITSRDGVLTAALPVDLLVHRHLRGLQGTRTDGSLRVHLEHLPADKIIRLVGHAKDVLTRRGWEVVKERHYEHASELTLRQGTRAAPTLLRSMWFVPEGGRVLLCDAIGTPRWETRMGEAFGALCRSVRVAPLPAPAEERPDAGPSARGAADPG